MAYLTRQEAADRLAVSLRTLDGLIQRGALPAYRVGATLVRIDENELRAYMATRLVAPLPKEKAKAPRPCRYVPGMKVV